MRKIYRLSGANIYTIPAPITYKFNLHEVALADSHGNVAKIWFFLMRHGLITFRPEVHNRLIEIFLLPFEKLTEAHIGEFETLVNTMKVNKAAFTKMVWLLGDNLCDRMGIDWWVLLTLEAYQKKGGVFCINVSNHETDFILFFEKIFGQPITDYIQTLKKKDKTFTERSYDIYGNSKNKLFWRSLGYFIEILKRKWVTKERFKQVVDEVYRPALITAGSSVNTNTLDTHIFTHAPVGLGVLYSLAQLFGKKLNATEIPDIDSINQLIAYENNKFQEYVQNYRVRVCYQHSCPETLNSLTSFYHLIYDRFVSADKDDRPANLPYLAEEIDSEVHYFFGHDHPSESSKHEHNLHCYAGLDLPKRESDGSYQLSEEYIDMASENKPYNYALFYRFAQRVLLAIDNKVPDGQKAKDAVRDILLHLFIPAFALMSRPNWAQEKMIHHRKQYLDLLEELKNCLESYEDFIVTNRIQPHLPEQTDKTCIEKIIETFKSNIYIPPSSLFKPELIDSNNLLSAVQPGFFSLRAPNSSANIQKETVVCQVEDVTALQDSTPTMLAHSTS